MSSSEASGSAVNEGAPIGITPKMGPPKGEYLMAIMEQQFAATDRSALQAAKEHDAVEMSQDFARAEEIAVRPVREPLVHLPPGWTPPFKPTPLWTETEVRQYQDREAWAAAKLQAWVDETVAAENRRIEAVMKRRADDEAKRDDEK